MINQPNVRQLKTAILISGGIAVALLVALCLIGNRDLFLLLNGDLGGVGDTLFPYITDMGTGYIFIPVLLFFILRRRQYTVLLVTSFAFSALFPYLIKLSHYPYTLRPTAAIAEKALIHTVLGVHLLTRGSFPSGHTTTAFTVFLLLCLVVNKKWMLPVGLAYAVLVAYSRIYLAQHFPADVVGGIVSAIMSVALGLWAQRLVARR